MKIGWPDEGQSTYEMTVIHIKNVAQTQSAHVVNLKLLIVLFSPVKKLLSQSAG